MKRLLIHIGSHKTGSTALQQMLAEEKEVLLSQGLNYPSILGFGHRWQDKQGVGSGNGTPISLGQISLSGACELALHDVGANGMALISSELLEVHAATNEFWDEIATVRSGHYVDLQVLYYVRNPMGLLLSSFNLDVKVNGFSGTLSDYVIHAERDPRSMQQFHVAPHVLRLGKEHLPEGFTVVHYDSVKGNLLAHFLEEVLGVDATAIYNEGRTGVNASAHPLQIALLRGINDVDPSIARYLGWEYTDLMGCKPNMTSPAQFAISQRALDRFRERFEAFRNACEVVFPDFPLLDYEMTSSLVAVRDTEPDVQRDVFAMGQSLAHSFRSGYLHRREEERFSRHAPAAGRK